MDLSNLLPGFSFDSDASKVSIASKNLRNDCSCVIIIAEI